ncbi:hypothetical protein C3L33_01575, partial [Rhododendron williamsianum]
MRVRRCREVLSFSNTSVCKSCQIKVCLKHRFPTDHSCKPNSSSVTCSASDNKFLIALAKRTLMAVAMIARRKVVAARGRQHLRLVLRLSKPVKDRYYACSYG